MALVALPQLDPALVRVLLAFARQDQDELLRSVLELLDSVTVGALPMDSLEHVSAAELRVAAHDAATQVSAYVRRGDLKTLLSSLLALMNSDDKATMIAARRVVTAALGFSQIPRAMRDLVVCGLDAMLKRNMEAVVKLLCVRLFVPF